MQVVFFLVFSILGAGNVPSTPTNKRPCATKRFAKPADGESNKFASQNVEGVIVEAVDSSRIP